MSSTLIGKSYKTIKSIIMKKKQYYRPLFMLSMLLILVVSCNPEDGEDGLMGEQGIQGEQGIAGEDATITTPAAYGIWEVTSELGTDIAQYIYINEDNTLNILSEDQLGFKRAERTNVIVSKDQITIGLSGYYGSLVGINNYEVNGDILTLTRSYESDPLIMQRSTTAPNSLNWIKELTILAQGNTTWDRAVDIAFDGTYLLGYNDNNRNIEQINPIDFSLEGVIPTSRSAYVVEIEKSDDPSRQLFQSGSDNYHSYIYSSNSFNYTSIDLGDRITGIASKVPGELWVASGYEDTLYHYFSHGPLSPGEILGTIPLNINLKGLDYRDGFLYVTEENRVHKCQLTPEFRAIETYELKKHYVSGITFDGTNFWLAATDRNDLQKLVKIDLSI